MKLEELLKKINQNSAKSIIKMVSGEKNFCFSKNSPDVLSEILNGAEINSVALTPEKMQSGGLAVCTDGKKHRAEDFARAAAENGIAAIACERDLPFDGIKIFTSDCRKFATEACKVFYGEPQKKLRTIAVMGTNGKTSVCAMIRQIFADFGVECGSIGTAGAIYAGKTVQTGMTTPDPPELFSLLADMVKLGVKVVCMEYSAHAIYYKKADFKFDVAVFTNCTRDHLDFFENYAQYEAVKLSAFLPSKARIAVINGDDPCSRKIAAARKSGVITYGMNDPCDVFAVDERSSEKGEEFVLNLFDCVFTVKSSLVGRFNVYNMLAAATACALCGVKTASVAKSLAKIKPIAGRMQRIACDSRVFVDYAHTPDGLENALNSLNEIKGSGRLICVFGCGGNRDKEKRPLMGEISGKLADFTVITSDNPRFEEPCEIIAQIEKGVRKVTRSYVIIHDREKAINYALNFAKENDLVLIAGKGAEKTQEIMGVFSKFSDEDVVAAFTCGDNKSEDKI